jgi:hypothetical protein
MGISVFVPGITEGTCFYELPRQNFPVALFFARVVSVAMALALGIGRPVTTKAHQGGRPPPPIVANLAFAHVAGRNMTLSETQKWHFF